MSRRELLLQEIREGRTYLESLPETVNIEFTGKCHVDPPCTYCVGKHAEGYVAPGHISDELLNQYWPYLLQARRVNDCTYGEFQLYPAHETVVQRLSEAGVYFGFTTTGQLLTEKRSRFLIAHADKLEFAVSLNAATEATYFQYQGKGFDVAIRNLQRFCTLHTELRPGKPLPFSLSYIVMRGNRHEVLDFLRLAQSMGVDRIILRHLFDMRAGAFETSAFGYLFRYEDERLWYADYLEIRGQIEEREEFRGLNISFEWKPEQSFIREQAEDGIDIPCLFPWKFLCVRPLHDMYTPCCFLKKSVAPPSEHRIEDVWNGEVIVGMRTELAAGKVPHFCRTHGDACPLVLESHRPAAPLVQISL